MREGPGPGDELTALFGILGLQLGPRSRALLLARHRSILGRLSFESLCHLSSLLSGVVVCCESDIVDLSWAGVTRRDSGSGLGLIGPRQTAAGRGRGPLRHGRTATVKSNSCEPNRRTRLDGSTRRKGLPSRRRRRWEVVNYYFADKVSRPHGPVPACSNPSRHCLRLAPNEILTNLASPARREAFVRLAPRTTLPEVTIPPTVTPGLDVTTLIIDTSREYPARPPTARSR